MHPRRYALFGGVLMLLMGTLSLVPWLSQYPDLPALKIDVSYGLFLGLFPMNIFNKIALIVFGMIGISASVSKTTGLPSSITWSRAVFWVMGVAAVLGMIPATQTLYGYWPLYGNEIVANAVFAIGGLYFGYLLKSKAHRELDKKFPNDQLHPRGV